MVTPKCLLISCPVHPPHNVFVLTTFSAVILNVLNVLNVLHKVNDRGDSKKLIYLYFIYHIRIDIQNFEERKLYKCLSQLQVFISIKSVWIRTLSSAARNFFAYIHSVFKRLLF